ncbi:hypothetical protein PT286_08510 [Neisseriaceae bacterium ESL0693]|nr:hypothetical protein [Neisseriaceae bacterium ESL0693]
MIASSNLILSVELNHFNDNEIDELARIILAAMLRDDGFYKAMHLWSLRDSAGRIKSLLSHDSLARVNGVSHAKYNKSYLISAVVETMPCRLDTTYYMVDMLNDIHNGLMLLYIEMKEIFSGYIYAGYLKQAGRHECHWSKAIKYLNVFDAWLNTRIKGKGYVRLAETFLDLFEHVDEQQIMHMRNRFALYHE